MAPPMFAGIDSPMLAAMGDAAGWANRGFGGMTSAAVKAGTGGVANPTLRGLLGNGMPSQVGLGAAASGALRIGLGNPGGTERLDSARAAVTMSMSALRATEHWPISYGPKIELGTGAVGDLSWWRGVERSTIAGLEWGLPQTIKQSLLPPTSVLARNLGIVGLGAFARRRGWRLRRPPEPP